MKSSLFKIVMLKNYFNFYVSFQNKKSLYSHTMWVPLRAISYEEINYSSEVITREHVIQNLSNFFITLLGSNSEESFFPPLQDYLLLSIFIFLSPSDFHSLLRLSFSLPPTDAFFTFCVCTIFFFFFFH